MKAATAQIRSDIGLVVTLLMAISRRPRQIRAERSARSLPELSDTQLSRS